MGLGLSQLVRLGGALCLWAAMRPKRDVARGIHQ